MKKILKIKPPLEKDVQKAILIYLQMHRNVAWAERFNSGGAPLVGKGGRVRPIKFNTLVGCPDILGQLNDGKLLAIEVKRPGWKAPKDDHEREQLAFIQRVNVNNGVGFFATSIDDVKKVIG